MAWNGGSIAYSERVGTASRCRGITTNSKDRRKELQEEQSIWQERLEQSGQQTRRSSCHGSICSAQQKDEGAAIHGSYIRGLSLLLSH